MNDEHRKDVIIQHTLAACRLAFVVHMFLIMYMFTVVPTVLLEPLKLLIGYH